jgi:hypothetical protein
MQAGRAAVAARILANSRSDIVSYPLWVARNDLDAYYFAGSLPGAILGTAADAKIKKEEAEVQIRAITGASVTPDMFSRRASLATTIDGLDAAKAKALVTRIETLFPDVKAFIDAQYPAGIRAADANGSQAKAVLKRAAILSVRSPQDAERWLTAVGGL